MFYFPLQSNNASSVKHPEVVKVARNANGEPTTVHANGPFTCFGCDGTLVFRRSHKRTRSFAHKTTTFQVQDHFVHATAAHHCHGETYAHAAAKALLLQRPSHPLWFHCSRCDTQKPFHLLVEPHTNTRCVLEYLTPLNGRRVDVAFLADTQGEEPTLAGIIEICKTHACDDEKLHDLHDLVGDRWCELYAQDVLECMTIDVPIPVATCSATVCDTCRASMPRTQTRPWEVILDFGKYSGASLESLMEVDPKYVWWLSTGGEGTLMTFAIPSVVVKRARSLVKERYCVCTEGQKCQKCQEWKASAAHNTKTNL